MERIMPEDEKEAKMLEALQKAAELGDIEAQTMLGFAYMIGTMGVTRNLFTAVEWFKKAADQGDSKAQDMLALMNAIGVGITKDFAKAIEWVQIAAEHADIYARQKLFRMYSNGGNTKH